MFGAGHASAAVLRFLGIFPAFWLFGCVEAPAQSELGHTRAPIIFGTDDRSEVYAHASGSRERQLSAASAAVLPAAALKLSGGGVELLAPTLRTRVGLCADE